MVIAHALVASPVEGLVTALVVAYLQRANQSALQLSQAREIAPEASGFARWRIFWIVLAVLVFLVPLGLLAPGTAWGEWGTEQLAERGLAFIPEGMAKLSGLWSAPLSGYNVQSLGNNNLGYVISAVVGTVVIALVVWLFTLLVTARKTKSN